MSVRLRMQRHGSKKRPFYRVVAADIRAPRDGRYIEQLGVYDPLHDDPIVVNLDLERVDYWLGVGAQPTDTVTTLIQKVRDGKTRTVQELEAQNREQKRQEREEARKGVKVSPALAARKANEAPAEESAPAAEEAPAEEAASDESSE